MAKPGHAGFDTLQTQTAKPGFSGARIRLSEKVAAELRRQVARDEDALSADGGGEPLG